MKHRVAELEGALLDAAVAKAEGRHFRVEWWPMGKPKAAAVWITGEDGRLTEAVWQAGPYRPSTEWAIGGPILERERIMLNWTPDTDIEREGEPLWLAHCAKDKDVHTEGPTPLVAAMRAYVTSKLGEEVDLLATVTGGPPT